MYLLMLFTYIASDIEQDIPWEQSDQGSMINYSLKCTGIYDIKQTIRSIRKLLAGCSVAL